MVVDAEFGRPIAHTARGFTITVAERDYVPVLILERGPLEVAKGQTLLATFERGSAADQAVGPDSLGNSERSGFVPAARIAGATGQAAVVGKGLEVFTWLNLDDTAGTIAFDGLVPATGKGQVLSLGRLLEVSIQADPQDKKVMQVVLLSRQDAAAKESTTVTLPAPGEGWHRFALQWANGQATLSIGDKTTPPLAIPALGFGQKIAERSTQSGYNPGLSTPLVIGARGTALTAVDNLLLARQRQ